MKRLLLVTLLCPALVAAADALYFDDFSQPDRAALQADGWVLRSGKGFPGVPGAHWWVEGIGLRDDPAVPGNRLLRLATETDGSNDGTRQAQLCHQRHYLDGTYAVRIRFTDQPVSGPNGDEVVQTFYTLGAWGEPFYSEFDHEYLPNGGWGHVGPTLTLNKWESRPFPPGGEPVATSGRVAGSHAGWHTLVLHARAGELRFFVDGKPAVTHQRNGQPPVLMSMNFNLWFVADHLAPTRKPRRWEQDVDWVLHVADQWWSTDEVNRHIADWRKAGQKRLDTMQPKPPVPPSLCEL
ncbi:glycoside hydrolase family 16 protein [Chitiniphilus shinanonensis]|uniref:glycoside hydrolase family 16 protein n=1 Tax=Chitiniphilus shinanonensis TaxID=553088 RepID=UPI00302ED9A3